VEEAYRNIREAMEGYLEMKLEHSDPIPEPVPEDEYSGKFNFRIPKSLHKQLPIWPKRKTYRSINMY
jgi:predicted HicB family RNase H-like nuclease